MTTQPSATPEPYAHEWHITLKADEPAGAIDALFNCIKAWQAGSEPIGGTCPRSMGNRQTYDVVKAGREGRTLETELAAWQDRCSAAEIARDAAQLVLDEERKELAAARAECERLRKTNLAQSADLATCAEALTKLTNWIEESRFQPRVGDTLQQVERIISSAVKAIKGEIP